MKQDELNKGKNLKSLISEYFIFVIFIIIVIGLTILKPSFITPSNLVNILKQASINGILAFGMMFVIISGGFDMSVGSTVAFSGILAAMLGQGNNPLVLALGAALLAGLGVGLINGVGMSEEDVEALNRRLSQVGGETPETVNMSALPRKKRGGIALANVNTRVRLMFGDDYGLRVYSVPGIGTECCLTLPLRYEE